MPMLRVDHWSSANKFRCSVNTCSVARLVYSLSPTLDAMWDLSWNSPTPTGLAALEINLASICAALPVFWPVVRDKWAALVTYEVIVASAPGVYTGKRKDESLLRQTESAESDLGLVASEPPKFKAAVWDPNALTGMGDTETVVESGAASATKAKEKRSFGV